MIKNTSKISEFNHFTNLAKEWWDPYGNFRILHKITPIRMKYIKSIINQKNNDNNNKIISLAGLKILDVGCGGGLICEPLAKLGGNITGIDFIKENIKIAKNHAKISKLKINYLFQDVENMKLNDKYDIILLLEVLEHLNDWKKIILNIKKHLKPKGKLIISTINRNFFSKIFAIHIAENILGWIPKNTHSYEKFITPNEMTSFLIKNNFKILDLTGMIFNPISYEWEIKKNRKKINYFCSAINSN